MHDVCVCTHRAHYVTQYDNNPRGTVCIRKYFMSFCWCYDYTGNIRILGKVCYQLHYTSYGKHMATLNILMQYITYTI